MAKKDNNFNFDIPPIIIFLACVFCWPAGVVLLFLRAFSEGVKKYEKNRRKQDGSGTYNYNYNYYNYNKPGAENTYSGTGNGEKNEKPKKSKKKSSPAVKVLTAGAIGSFLLSAIMLLGTILSFSSYGGDVSAVFFLIFLVFGALFTIGASGVRKRETRLSRIKAIIGDKKSINLTKLASASNESIKRVRKDVQRLIDQGEFGERAYIDLGTNNFMRDPDAEPDDPDKFDYKSVYGDLLKKDKKKDKEKKSEKPEADNVKSEEKPDEKASDKDNFETIIREIRRLNDEIKDREVSERIYKIEAHTKNIFDYVTDHPEAMPQIRTFMNYYLPTTLKLLESYSRIERVGVAGENMQKSKTNIENTLDLLVYGFEQQVDQLFKNESIDISSDIAVLEQMMQKDGLDGRNDFDISSYIEKNKANAENSKKANADNAYTDGYSDEISNNLSGGASARYPKQKQ